MTTPEAFSANHTVDFRAPPPSPVAPGRRSSFTNDDVLTEYLHKSVKVPDLILPDRVFPRQKSVQNPEKLDFEKLEAIENESAKKILESVALVGCLEVINHGISRELIKLVLDLSGGIFEISPEKKRAVARSPPERRYGFEEIQGEEEMNRSLKDESEEFVWCGEESMKLEMEGIWSTEYYSNFSAKLEKLSGQIEEIGVKILIFLQGRKSDLENGLSMEEEVTGKLCYIHKHCRRDESENSLKYDVIRMLIRGSEFPHALCLHICSGSTEFHVYSKKGWVSFCPNQDSIVITVGDKLQAWSHEQYKHVIGRPIFNGNDEKYISLSFLFSPSKVTNSIKDEKITTISLSQQIIFSVWALGPSPQKQKFSCSTSIGNKSQEMNSSPNTKSLLPCRAFEI